MKGEMMSKEMMGSPSTRRGKASREHSVHFPDSLMTEQEKGGSAGEAEVDTVDLGRKGGSEGEREEQEELERLRSQMQQRERRDSLELVKEVPTFTLTDLTCLLNVSIFRIPFYSHLGTLSEKKTGLCGENFQTGGRGHNFWGVVRILIVKAKV